MKTDPLINFLRSQAITPGASAIVPARRLVEALDISRATLMRQIQQVGDQVISAGNARRRAYALRRSLRGNFAPLPVYQIDALGVPSHVGSLNLAYGHGCWLEGTFEEWPIDAFSAHMRDGWYEGVPYQLSDMRPDGYLGRALARTVSAMLRVSENPTEWSDDDFLFVLSMVGEDAPGNMILGEIAYMRWSSRRFENRSDAVAQESREHVWLQRAGQAVQDGVAGSSAAGEFPKFTGSVRLADGRVQHVLVKFSGLDGSPSSRRWADLLVCEHLALETLSDAGVPVARSRILQAGGRTFFEVDRFDRHGEHGRSPVCSWRAICDGLLGKGADLSWEDVGRLMLSRGLIDRSDSVTLRTLGVLTYFGRFIQNSDMHMGNLSFVPQGSHFRVAPAYDMLPMHYAPVRGIELPPRTYQVAMPSPASFHVALPAALAARDFWIRASADERISDEFRATCEANALAIQPMIALMSAGRAPTAEGATSNVRERVIR